MRRYLNSGNVPLSVAVYLATDNYDYVPNTLSATSFLKPTRQIILGRRVPDDMSKVDIMTLVKSRTGTSVHDGIEKAWNNGRDRALQALGYPQRIIDKIVVNPDPDDVTEDQIPVYMEIRSFRELEGYTVSGKFDFLAEGRIEDFKNTGVFTWVNNTKDDDYILQGSIYRWLNPKIVTEDEMRINFIFSDWQAFRAKTDQNYPAHPIMTRTYPLLSEQEIEAFMRNKLREIEHYKDAEEAELPFCTDKELWRKEPEFKYYKNPKSTGRSTKNFKVSDFGSIAAAKQAAYARLAKDKGVGTVVEVSGEVVACKYCPAFPICSQKDQLIADGSLKL
jgi:hypothetical protein